MPDHIDHFNKQGAAVPGAGPTPPITGEGRDFVTAGPGDLPDSVKDISQNPANFPTKGQPSTGERPGLGPLRLILIQGLMGNPEFDWRNLLGDPSFMALIDQKANLLLDHWPGYVPV